jgi:hypothetical protein
VVDRKVRQDVATGPALSQQAITLLNRHRSRYDYTRRAHRLPTAETATEGGNPS